MIWPPHVRFFLTNRQDIQSVIELDRRAKEDLPPLVGQLLRTALKSDMATNAWKALENPIVELPANADDVEWYDPSFFNVNTNVGPFFGIWGLSKVGVDEDEGPFLFLQFWLGGNERRKEVVSYLHKIRTVVDGIKRAKTLIDVRFDGRPYGDEAAPNVLAYSAINDILNLDELSKDSETVARRVVERAKKFTEVFAPEFASLGGRS